jgi:hypothetical protein
MYEIINPTIIGKFGTTYEADTPLDAAKEFWNRLSALIVNEVPNMCFSLRNNDNSNVSHFVVNENQSGNNMVTYVIKPIMNVSKDDSKEMCDIHDTTITAAFAKTGGKDPLDSSSHDSDDSDDSDAPLVIREWPKFSNYPIYYFRYAPWLYRAIKSSFIPLFVYPINPYIEIGFSSAFWS